MSAPINFRFAVPEDAPAFADWAAKNPDIPVKDVKAALTENNPTCKVLIIESGGTPVLYVPVYCALRIAYLGFNPEITNEKLRVGAMNAMLLYLRAFAKEFGVNEIDCLTKEGYPVARWAEKHGFEPENRQLYTAKVKPLV